VAPVSRSEMFHTLNTQYCVEAARCEGESTRHAPNRRLLLSSRPWRAADDRGNGHGDRRQSPGFHPDPLASDLACCRLPTESKQQLPLLLRFGQQFAAARAILKMSLSQHFTYTLPCRDNREPFLFWRQLGVAERQLYGSHSLLWS
jgi:hypothetical protein